MILPVLYTFRRCPYAMRARLALHKADIAYEHREVELKAKPAHMLMISPKGTVPVLELADGQVIDQSLDVMLWALRQQDPDRWLDVEMDKIDELIQINDNEFKTWLDRYKYHSRYPEQGMLAYRERAEEFVQELEQLLTVQGGTGLLTHRWTLVDAAIFPFVRQFACVDRDWFDSSAYSQTRRWLRQWEETAEYEYIMKKHKVWKETALVA